MIRSFSGGLVNCAENNVAALAQYADRLKGNRISTFVLLEPVDQTIAGTHRDGHHGACRITMGAAPMVNNELRSNSRRFIG
jgi:hypothetical protein